MDQNRVDRGTHRVPLRRYRWARHEAYVQLTDGWVEIHVPGILRRRATWRIPAAEVAVVDASSLERPTLVGGIAAVAFVDPVTLPYLASTSAWAGPNLQLLFETPLPVTRRLLARGHRGADGIALRAVDPVAAVTALTDAGLRSTGSPLQWLTSRRETTTALHARASAAARQSADTRVRIGAVALLPLLALTAWWAAQARSGLVIAVFAAECALAAALPAVLRRRDRA